jgi:hypothetical protein
MQAFATPAMHATPPMSPAALTCPRCLAAATPAPTAQSCASCHGSFGLYAGPRLEASVVPPPVDPRLPRIVVKSAGVVLMKRGMVAPEGVSEGTLDPVTGFIPMDQSGVLYTDVITIAVWRKIDVVRLVVALLIPLPVAILFVVAAVSAWAGLLVPAAAFAAIVAYMLYRALSLRAHMVRIAGTWRTITIRFDSPMWRRRRFHDELLRRVGIAAAGIP